MSRNCSTRSIDVWTALNVQHLESLADVVSRITGVAVRETVPDIVLRDADDIMLVDITAEELIARLKDGKVYLPRDGETRAAEVLHLRNLTALRELALRRTAARVDDQMVEQLAPERDPGALGDGASGFSSASAPTLARSTWCAPRAGSRPASTRVGCAVHAQGAGRGRQADGATDEALALAQQSWRRDRTA